MGCATRSRGDRLLRHQPNAALVDHAREHGGEAAERGPVTEWASGSAAFARHTVVASRVPATIEDVRARGGPGVRGGVVTAALCAMLACAAPLGPVREAAARERGAAAIAPFKQRLLAELTAALASGGAENALDVCRLRAPALAREVSTAAARVGRTSHKLRNPDNAPPAWAAPLLASYVAGERTNESSVVPLRRGGAGYVEPIFTGPLCLTCHGEQIAPSLRAKLSALYPEDRATGFRAGELRGLFWVELAAEDTP